MKKKDFLVVSLTGIMDNKWTDLIKINGLDVLLQNLRQMSVDTNKEYGDILKINQSTNYNLCETIWYCFSVSR